jgi:general secretion pathway protein D
VEEVGVMLRFQIEPLKEGDGDIVRFKRFEIRVVDFEGFVNYGSPITSSQSNSKEIRDVVLTENRIDMPIFSRRYINSNPCVYDGHTIAIGGMIQDEVQKVEDKIPVLGDLPFVGRLFRSEAESHVRKNLMVFVTADIIDPFGKPLRERDSGTTTAPATGTVPGLFPDDALVTP